nr:hypothetical protein [Oharaeibacter diazotrophicus]
MAALEVGELHAGPEVLQAVGEVLRVAALGLETGHEHLGAGREPARHPGEFGGPGEFVVGDHGGDLALERPGADIVALAAAGGEVAQPVADQPGAVAEVVLERALEVLEVAEADGAAVAPDRGLGDADAQGHGSRGLEGQAGEVGEEVAGDRRLGAGGAGEAGFEPATQVRARRRRLPAVAAVRHREPPCRADGV